jgi:hypothetical protein
MCLCFAGAGARLTADGTERRALGGVFRSSRRTWDMIRLLLVMAVIALGADALLNNGAYTQAAWQQLQTIKIETSKDGTAAPEKRV